MRRDNHGRFACEHRGRTLKILSLVLAVLVGIWIGWISVSVNELKTNVELISNKVELLEVCKNNIAKMTINLNDKVKETQKDIAKIMVRRSKSVIR